MKFDNQKVVFKLHFLKIIFAILIASTLLIFYLTSIDDKILEFAGVEKRWIIIAMVAGYLFFYIYHLIVKTSYLYFSDEGSKIVVRFYLLRPLNPAKRSIEIPKNQFYKYTINKTSLTEEVVLYTFAGNKISKYPPFSLKGLTKSQKASLLKTLNQYSQDPDLSISQP